MVVVLLAWVINQLIGFTLLNYPTDLLTIIWGLVIGVSGVMAFVSALLLHQKLMEPSLTFKGVAICVIAFVVYEATMFLGGVLLGSGTENFTFAIIAQIAYVNVIALAVFILTYKIILPLPERHRHLKTT